MPSIHTVKPVSKAGQKPFVLYLFIISLVISLIPACSELDTHDPAYRFQQTDDLYSASMRWGEWHSLFQLMKPDPNNPSSKLTPPSDDFIESLSHIKVSHVEVINSGILEENKSGKTIYQIEYHPDDSTIIKKIRHTVNWWYDSKNNQWFTDTPLPEEFKPPQYKTIKLSPK